MIVPPYLKKGDAIAIVCTARAMKLEDLQYAIGVLKSWGLKVVIGKTVGLVHGQFAGTDEERATDFQEMLERKDVKAILIGRGGYGTVRMVDLVDFSPLKKQAKWIVGFSDITVLHSHLHTQLQVVSIHAHMPSTYATSTPEALASLRNALFGNQLLYPIVWHPLNKKSRVGVEQILKGIVVGGNLSVLYSILGSVSDINTDGKILLLEDLEEYAYHVDRMLMALKRSGKLANLKALLVGDIAEKENEDNPYGKSIAEIIMEHTQGYDYPVLFNFPLGHIANNWAVYMGGEVELELKINGEPSA